MKANLLLATALVALTFASVIATSSNPLFLSQPPSTNVGAGESLSSGAAVILNIPPRQMWGWGAGMNGYCGETSFQSVGIYYGNWYSQERVRYADGNQELLIAVNDEKAAKNLALSYTVWNYNQKTPQATNYLTWIKNNINNGYPVIAGWYEKQPKGDEDYDHIMPIIGYEVKKGDNTFANGSLMAVPTNTDIYHNDLYLQETSITYGADAFKTRKTCSQSKAPVQPYDYCLPQDYDYGIAITGNVDPNKLTYRTFLTVSIWKEPDWGAEDKKYETPISFTVTATTTGLTAGKKYALLRFDSFEALGGSKNFLTASYSKRYDFTATSDTYVNENLDALKSDGIYFFRCVAV